MAASTKPIDFVTLSLVNCQQGTNFYSLINVPVITAFLGDLSVRHTWSYLIENRFLYQSKDLWYLIDIFNDVLILSFVQKLF